MTEYVILVKRTSNTDTTANPSGDHGWAERGKQTGSSAEAAVRAYVEKANLEGGTFVAIPARSFTPITIEIEKVRRIKVVDGTKKAQSS